METKLSINTHHVPAVVTESIALQSVKASEAEPMRLEKILMSSIVMAYDVLGWDPVKENIRNMVQMLPEELLYACPYIRLEEIPLAIKKGIYGELGDFIGINVATIIKFCRSYYQSEQRTRLVKSNAVKDEPEVPSLEKIRLEEDKILINAFEKYLKSGSYDDIGNHIYNKLDQRGYLTFSKDRKLSFMEDAKKKVLNKLDPSLAGNLDERRKFTSLVKSISNGSDQGKNMIIREAKQIALITFFSDIKEMDMHVSDLINRENED